MSLRWTGAPQSIPEVISAAWKIRPTSEVKKMHFTFLSLFLCSDVDLEAGFVIYVKNRSRVVFGRSLRVEKYKFEAGSPYFSPPEPLEAP